MGRKLAKRSNCLRSVTLMLLNPPPIGVVTGPLSATLLRFDGFGEIGRDVFAEDLEGFGPGGEALPFELHAGGFEDADDSLRDFGADAVAGDEGDFVCHELSLMLLIFSY